MIPIIIAACFVAWLVTTCSYIYQTECSEKNIKDPTHLIIV